MDDADATSTATSAFGRAATARRAELGLTRKEVASRAELSYPYLADIESGRKHPSAKALDALARALELRPSELLERADALAGIAPTVAMAAPPRPSGGPGDGSGASGAGGGGWFDGSRVTLASTLGPPAGEDLRAVIRAVVREELERDALQAGPAPTALTPAAPVVPAPGVPALSNAIRAALPGWLRKPARTGTDLAIQGVVIERLHHLDPNASPETVRAEIDAALDHLIDRAHRRRRA